MTGFLIIGVFAFILIPNYSRLHAVNSFFSTIKENDINTSGMFYSETDVISESENYFQFQ